MRRRNQSCKSLRDGRRRGRRPWETRGRHGRRNGNHAKRLKRRALGHLKNRQLTLLGDHLRLATLGHGRGGEKGLKRHLRLSNCADRLTTQHRGLGRGLKAHHGLRTRLGHLPQNAPRGRKGRRKRNHALPTNANGRDRSSLGKNRRTQNGGRSLKTGRTSHNSSRNRLGRYRNRCRNCRKRSTNPADKLSGDNGLRGRRSRIRCGVSRKRRRTSGCSFGRTFTTALGSPSSFHFE